MNRDNGKENGNYYIVIGLIWGLYRDTGRQNGNYHLKGLGFRISLD